MGHYIRDINGNYIWVDDSGKQKQVTNEGTISSNAGTKKQAIARQAARQKQLEREKAEKRESFNTQNEVGKIVVTGVYQDPLTKEIITKEGFDKTLIGGGGLSGYDPLLGTAVEWTVGGKMLGDVWKGVQYSLPKLQWLWNNGRIFNKNFQYNPRNWYRGVGYPALEDAEKTGVVRGIHRWNNQSVGPYFGRGFQPREGAPVIIEGTPESATWVDPFSSTFKSHSIEPLRSDVQILTKNGKMDYSKLSKENGFLQEGQTYEGFPSINGNVNATPVSSFTFYKKYPIIGYRKYFIKSPTKNFTTAKSVYPFVNKAGLKSSKSPLINFLQNNRTAINTPLVTARIADLKNDTPEKAEIVSDNNPLNPSKLTGKGILSAALKNNKRATH